VVVIKVGMHEAKTRLSELVHQAEVGEEVVIARNGTPVARLIPIARPSSLASARGAWRGRVQMADDFDDLPGDIADALGAR
jgi:prevent-host-death family protein